jgi:hypothetical protein
MLAVAFALVVAGAGAIGAAELYIAITFTASQNLSSTSTVSQAPDVALGPDGPIYVAWEEWGEYGVLFARSVDGGATFTPPQNLLYAGPEFSNGGVQVAAGAPGVVHVAATLYDMVFGGAEIVYLRSTDGGQTFPSPGVVSVIDAANSYSPSIAAGWALALAWSDANLATGRSVVGYRQSTDGGATFSPARELSDPTVGSLGPSVAVSEPGNVYVAWMQTGSAESIVFTRSGDGGLTFSTPTVLSSAPKSWAPTLLTDSLGIVHLLWGEGTAYQDQRVFYARSTNGGSTFSPGVVVSDPAENAILMDAAVAADGTLAVGWLEGPHDDLQCRVTVSTDRGITFSRPAASAPGCSGLAPRSSSELHVAFHGAAPTGSWSDVFHARGAMTVAEPPPPPQGFYTVSPCRLADTRPNDFPLDPYILWGFDVRNRCGIPRQATAVALNVTVVQPTHPGHVVLFPGGTSPPLASTVNFKAGQIRGNNAVVKVGPDGQVWVKTMMPQGYTHAVVDVFGYFRE